MDLTYNTYHTFEYDGRYYLYDNEQLFSCIIEANVYNALINNDTSLLTEEELNLFRTFREHNIFFVDEPRSGYSNPTYDKVIISMALFHGCNLNCKYCFAEAGENYKGEQRGFTESSISAALDFLLQNPYFSKYEYYRINLVSGGEPLLNKKLFRKFIEMAFARFEKAGKHLYVWFSTNGTLLSEEEMLFISKYNVGYGISLDGEQTVNDKLRIYGDGSGTYADVVRNIVKIQKDPRIPKRLKEMWGLMVYTQDNRDLLGNIKHLYELGFSTVQMRFVRSNDSSLVLEEREAIPQLLNFVSKIFEQAILGDDSLLRIISNDNDYLGKIIKRIVMQNPVEIRCGAGSCMLSFAADGYIYPCDCFVGNQEFIMGNFYESFDQDKLKVFEDLSVHNRLKCKRCWARFACGGDCYHNSYLKHGNMKTPDDAYCNIILPVIERIIACANQYQMNNPAGYNAYQNFLHFREKMSLK